MQLYAQARARDRREWGGGQERALKEKSAELAVFADEADSAKGWECAMAGWNAAHPKWWYHEVRTFTRDARHAYRRVTGKPLKWRRRGRRSKGKDRRTESENLQRGTGNL
jgi:hypothetical protein